ncbi:MAG: tetratricopeptide repeat protein [Phycisphaerales bacterium]|nr:tetratricopeptide repeat protein [Phycisphaerales bacterium]
MSLDPQQVQPACSPNIKPITCAIALGLIAILLIATLAAFGPGLDNQFLNWDDDRNFLRNPLYRGLGGEQLRWAWDTYHLGVWQPLSWLILSLQYEIGGLDPGTYHRFSLGLHALNAITFFLLTVVFLRVTVRRRFEASPAGVLLCAGLSAMLFAVHPLRVEPVTWISSQPYLPAALFFMFGVGAYVWGHREDGKPRTPWLWLMIAFVSYCLAVGAKAIAVTLPGVLLILDVYPLRRLTRDGFSMARIVRILVEKVPFFVVAVFISAWASTAKEISQPGRPDAFSWDAGLAQSAYGLAFYLLKTIAPTNLAAYYKLPLDLSLTHWPFALAAAGVVGMSVALFLVRKRWPAFLAAWLIYIVVLLPNIGLIQISQQIATDRYSYLAVMPVMVVFAMVLLAIWQTRSRHRQIIRPCMLIAVAILIVGLIVASRRHVRTWHDSVSLWTANLEVDPHCAHAECMLGQALALEDRFDVAKGHFERAIELRPDFSFAYSNLGTALLAQDQFEQAVRQFHHALNHEYQLDAEGLAKTHAALAIAYAKLGEEALAWKHIRHAQKLGLPADEIEKIVLSF